MTLRKTIIALLLTCVTASAAGPEDSVINIRNRHLADLTALEAAAAATPGDAAKAKAAADYRARYDKEEANLNSIFGTPWRNAFTNSPHADKDDVMLDVFKVTPFALAYVNTMSYAKQTELAEWIAAKQTLTKEDLGMAQFLPAYNANLAARVNDFALLLPSGPIRGYDYYKMRNIGLLKRKPPIETSMLTPEWIDMALAKSPLSPQVFIAGREYLMLKVAKALMDKRKAEGLPVEGLEFETALAPLLDKLRAPRFEGLRDATMAAGLDFGIPPVLPWADMDAVAADVMDAAQRKGMFTTAWGRQLPYEAGLGTVMLRLGETGYEEWRAQVLGND